MGLKEWMGMGKEKVEVADDFKNSATAAYNKKPLDSTEYAADVTKSITNELQAVGGLSQAESAAIGAEIGTALMGVVKQGDAAVNAGDKDAFNTIRTGVSVMVGKEVLPQIFEKYDIDPKIVISMTGPQALVSLAGRALGNEVSAADLKACADLTPEDMQKVLEKAGAIKNGEYLYGDFANMPAIDKDSEIDPNVQKSIQKAIDASVFAMNAAWKVAQLGRAVNEQNPKRIEFTGRDNFGTFSEMSKAMYQIGLNASGGDKKIAILRVVFEYAKDLKQMHELAKEL